MKATTRRAVNRRYPAGELPGQETSSEIPALIQAAVNDTSPAWQKIDTLVREQLQQSSAGANRGPTHDGSG